MLISCKGKDIFRIKQKILLFLCILVVAEQKTLSAAPLSHLFCRLAAIAMPLLCNRYAFTL